VSSGRQRFGGRLRLGGEQACLPPACLARLSVRKSERVSGERFLIDSDRAAAREICMDLQTARDYTHGAPEKQSARKKVLYFLKYSTFCIVYTVYKKELGPRDLNLDLNFDSFRVHCPAGHIGTHSDAIRVRQGAATFASSQVNSIFSRCLFIVPL